MAKSSLINSIIKGLIYCIRNKKTNNYYIGQTIYPIEQRIKDHILKAINYKDEYLIHQAIVYYGIENFEVVILESEIAINELNDKEIYYIKKFNTYNHGYNGTRGGNTCNFNLEKNIDLLSIDKEENYIATKLWNDISQEKIIELETLKTATYSTRKNSLNITSDMAKNIISLLSDKVMSDRSIAKYFNISVYKVKNINRGLEYRQLSINEGIDTFPIRRPCEVKQYYLMKDEVLEIIKHLKESILSLEEIGDLYDISEARVHNINIGKTYAVYTDKETYPIRKKHIRRDRKYIEENIAKLTVQEVLEIIDLLKYTSTLQLHIAEKYDVSPSEISAINVGKNWTYLTENENIPIRRIRVFKLPNIPIGSYNSKITPEQAKEIEKKLELTDISIKDIASQYAIKPSTVASINAGLSWYRTLNRKNYPIRKSKKLEPHQVREISELLYSNKKTIESISKKFNVSTGTIRGINNGKIWSDLLPEYHFPIRYLEKGMGNVYIDKVKAIKIMKMLFYTNISQKDIAKKLAVSEGIVNCINVGRTWGKYLPKNMTYPIRENNISEEIKRLIAKELQMTNNKYSEIAEKFKISEGTVTRVNSGAYRDILIEFIFPIRKYKSIPDNIILKIAKLVKETELSFTDISKKFGVSVATVSDINYGKSYRSILEDKYEFPIRVVRDKENEDKKILEIANILKYTKMTKKNIAYKFNVSYSKVCSINKGIYHKELLKEHTFPIRG